MTVTSCGLHCLKIQHIGVRVGETVILDDVNLHAHCGELTAIIGRNGAGKSTLLKAILGEIRHTGTVEFSGHTAGERVRKPRIGYVPQSLNIDSGSPATVYDMLLSYSSAYPAFLPRRKKQAEALLAHLKRFSADMLLDKPVGRLSGGELQRVLLTMAVMDAPNLLIMDEPVAGIDKNGMDLFYRIMVRLKKEYDMAIILISHDLDYVEKYADEVILLDTKIVARGTPAEVYASESFHRIFGKVEFETREEAAEGCK